MKDLDKSKAYDLRGLSEEQRKELLEWLKVNDEGWFKYEINVFEDNIVLGFKENFDTWVFDSIGKEILDATTLFPNNLIDLGFKPEKEGFYTLEVGNVEIDVRNAVYVTDLKDGEIVELFDYDFDKVKRLVELFK